MGCGFVPPTDGLCSQAKKGWGGRAVTFSLLPVDSTPNVRYHPRMVWYLNMPWDRVVIGGVLILYAAYMLWEHLVAYERIYSPSRAVSQAALKAAYWTACYGLTFGAVFWAVSQFLPAGRTRYLVGVAIWWLVSNVLSALVWKPLSRIIDELLD